MCHRQGNRAPRTNVTTVIYDDHPAAGCAEIDTSVERLLQDRRFEAQLFTAMPPEQGVPNPVLGAPRRPLCKCRRAR
jgi:hypothetical protein